MKNLIFLLMFSTIYSQTGTFKGHVFDRSNLTDFPAVNVKISQENKIIAQTETDFYGHFSVNELNFGTYQIKLEVLGYLPVIQNLNFTGNDSVVEFAFPEPCPESSTCPIDSSDKLIPIVYGFPGKKILKESKKGKVRLGGCVISICNPKWYCKKHDVSF